MTGDNGDHSPVSYSAGVRVGSTRSPKSELEFSCPRVSFIISRTFQVQYSTVLRSESSLIILRNLDCAAYDRLATVSWANHRACQMQIYDHCLDKNGPGVVSRYRYENTVQDR
jgi:hypothetical protein